MSKKNDGVKSTLGNIGKGILEDLQESSTDIKEDNNITVNTDNSNIVEKEKNNDVVTEINKSTNTEKSKGVNTKKSKAVKKEKNKRSFMLSDDAIQQLKMLSVGLDKDLGEIVNEAIGIYYKKNEKHVEEVLKAYFEELKK